MLTFTKWRCKSSSTICINELVSLYQVIAILGETLGPFDEDGIIPAFGFGDQKTKDKSVFSFKEEVKIVQKLG